MPAAFYITCGAVAAALGFALLAWALFGDRSRGRKRCPSCWYDMSAAVELRCPECGYVAQRERKLYKTRRRWKLALTSVVLFAFAAYLGLQPKAQRDGWLSMMPTTGLLLYFSITQNDVVLEAITNRMSRTGQTMNSPGARYYETDLIPKWQWRWLMHTVIKVLHEDNPPLARCERCLALAGAAKYIFEGEEIHARILDAVARQLEHQDGDTRSHAIVRVLDRTNPEGTLMRVTPLLLHSDPGVRDTAVTALCWLVRETDGHAGAFETLVEALESDDTSVVGSAAHCLGALVLDYGGDVAKVVAALHSAMDRTAGESGSFRISMIVALVTLSEENEVPKIVADFLASDDPYVRAGAFEAIRIRVPNRHEYVDAVVAELMRSDASLSGRYQAAWLLELCADPALLRPHEAALRELASHTGLPTSRAARTALWRLGIKLEPHQDVRDSEGLPRNE